MKRNREIWKGLIAIEGIDGAGTTTLTRNLSKSLGDRNISHRTGFEPTNGPIGRLIRDGLSGKITISYESLALLYSADRREHLYGRDGIKSVMEQKNLYLTDRYLFSSLAYQTLHSPWEWVDALNADYPLPGFLIFLGLPVDEAMKRISVREDREIFETETMQEQVSEAYARSINAYRSRGMNILELDSRRPPEDICSDALNFILSKQ